MKRLPRLPKRRGEVQKRVPKTGSFSPEVNEKINRKAEKEDSSRSRVIVTIISEYFKARDI